MIIQHPYFEFPSEDIVIWKYLSLWKFQEMLQKRELWFAHVNTFKDFEEGTLGRPPKLKQSAIIGRPFINLSKPLTDNERRNFALINCWHISDEESEYMWVKYADDHRGVALKTSISKLSCSLENGKDQEIYGGYITYGDRKNYELEFNNFQSFLIKSNCYAVDKEFRLATVNRSAEDDFKGEGIAINLESLISTIYLGRKSQKSIIRELISNQGLSIDILVSKLKNPAN